MSKQMLELADEMMRASVIQCDDGKVIDLSLAERDMIVSALRCSADSDQLAEAKRLLQPFAFLAGLDAKDKDGLDSVHLTIAAGRLHDARRFVEGADDSDDRDVAAIERRSSVTPEQVIEHIAKVARAVGWQAGVGASETAGMIVSCLAAKPELVQRFLDEGSGLLVSGEIAPENGCLTFHRIDGDVTTPDELRVSRQARKMLLDAGAKPRPQSLSGE